MTTPIEKRQLKVKKDIQFLDKDEGMALLDRQARRYLDMSGEEFLRAWESGEFDDDPDRPEVIRVAMLIPFAS